MSVAAENLPLLRSDNEKRKPITTLPRRDE
jgi:hypothetical protein